jgi:hypothetical protein
LKGFDLPTVQLDAVAGWTAEDAVRRSQLVQQLQDRITRSGVPIRHPFWGSQLAILLPTDRDEIRKLALEARSACAVLEKAARLLAAMFSAEPPNTKLEVDALWDSAQYVIGAPDLSGVAPDSPGWLSQEQQLQLVLASGKRHRILHRQYDAELRPDAWSTDTSELRQSSPF